ncbi:unnamed protein product [Vicia faba]|uniref:Uncharacterized protein n=1 Tax=Vicia faba TaxID=3906 RepID=A0AAV1A0S4_VICFA|nr:unnamed protein product [Vicia faba]
MFLWFLILRLIKKIKNKSMENKNKIQGGSFDPGNKRSFDPGRAWKLQSRESPGPFDWARQQGVSSLRSREEDCLLIMEVMAFDPGMRCLLRSSMLMGSIQRRCLLRSGLLYLKKYVSKIKCRAWVLNPRPFDPALIGVSSG